MRDGLADRLVGPAILHPVSQLAFFGTVRGAAAGVGEENFNKKPGARHFLGPKKPGRSIRKATTYGSALRMEELLENTFRDWPTE